MALVWRATTRMGSSVEGFDDAGLLAYRVVAYSDSVFGDGRVKAGPRYWVASRVDGGAISDRRWASMEEAQAEADTHHHAVAVADLDAGHDAPP